MHLSQIANVKIASFAFALSGSVAFVDFTCVHKPKHGNPLNEFFFWPQNAQISAQISTFATETGKLG